MDIIQQKKSKKRAVIISCNDSYNYNLRTKFLERTLGELGYSVWVISSDFDHRTKDTYKVKRDGLFLIHSIRYKKNVSPMRIVSLIDFSKKARKYVERVSPDFIYVSGPPNYLYKEFAKYRKKHSNTLVFAEVGDMWPESMPLAERVKKVIKLPLKYWAWIREHNLRKLDYVITECKLFEKQIIEYVSERQLETIYFCKDSLAPVEVIKEIDQNRISFVYLGSINNIIDIGFIRSLIDELIQNGGKVDFHIIGDGEQKPSLLDIGEIMGASILDHGAIFDDLEKQKIIAKCNFALNIMKESVCVGMTMKSMDYFQCGIPIINNIKGDIWDIVNDKQVGINVSRDNLSEVVKRILKMTDVQYKNMRDNTSLFFVKELSYSSFNRKFVDIIKFCERNLNR